jgi:cyclopropane fatty-acyl-phospholipid synthase-like methyltransferase
MQSMREAIKRIETDLNEEKRVTRILQGVDRDSKVLEIGCGFGQKMELLQSLGFKDILGVEKNEKIVEQVSKHDKRILSIREFDAEMKGERFDLLVLSHIIEHFQWEDLMDFLDHYLEFLNKGGFLLVISPVYHVSFYDDFDHVKPYLPIGFNNLYCGTKKEMQVYTERLLRLEDIYFRRAPFEIVFSRAFFGMSSNRLPRLFNIVLAMLYKVSFGLIGKTTGWIGLYRKSPASS